MEAGFSDIFSYNGPGPDDCAVADRHWEDGSIGPDAHATAEFGLAPKAPFIQGTGLGSVELNREEP